jgi:hypothetical protein
LGIRGRLTYSRNRTLLYLSFLILFLAVVDYYLFFDILAPSFPNGGSIRAYMGVGFIVPILLLTAIQVLFSSGILHLVMRGFYSERRDFQKAFFAGSVLVGLYSVYYVLDPSWGPYTFLTGSFRGVPASAYIVLGAWTACVILAITVLIRRMFGFKKGDIRWRTLILLSGSLFLVVLAFAEG